MIRVTALMQLSNQKVFQQLKSATRIAKHVQ